MSDFDLYPGQNCRCGNDSACENCGSGAAALEQHEAEQRRLEEATADDVLDAPLDESCPGGLKGCLCCARADGILEAARETTTELGTVQAERDHHKRCAETMRWFLEDTGRLAEFGAWASHMRAMTVIEQGDQNA